MPVAAGPRITLLRAVLYSLVSIALAAGLVVGIVWLAGSDRVDVKLGDDDFNAGSAEQRAEEVAEAGPILWAPLSRARNIWLQHLGENPETGWYAFEAQPPGAEQNCVVDWDSTVERFVDRCDPSRSYPPDGTGLTRFGVKVDDDGDLIIDVNANDSPVSP